MKDDTLICMAEIVGVHGVKGMVKLKVFSETPEILPDYAPLLNAQGEEVFELLTYAPHKNVWLATLEGVTDRTQAEKLRGTKLYVPRDELPEIEDDHTYYHADLIGLTAKDAGGAEIGRIVNVANFGAGDLLEIKPLTGATYYIPFTTEIVPAIDVKARTATVLVPAGLLDDTAD